MMPLTELQSFNSMIDRRMAASPVDGLIVYPEGMMACTQSCLLLLCGRDTLPQHASPALLCYRASEYETDFTANEAGHAGLCLQPQNTCTGETSFRRYALTCTAAVA